ncbi:hypothetical protein J2TS6_44270 [Paenibacillus albilobatus]|uniref:Uncharacterized protein n=1 Tax=Paenibacillus albilobatus TaxID=2716884 RepID=A0A919XJD2_9BACL|nr:hypothetical protein J2TS6_44270 [Paenibacillus albilobatus]
MLPHVRHTSPGGANNSRTNREKEELKELITKKPPSLYQLAYNQHKYVSPAAYSGNKKIAVAILSKEHLYISKNAQLYNLS